MALLNSAGRKHNSILRVVQRLVGGPLVTVANRKGLVDVHERLHSLLIAGEGGGMVASVPRKLGGENIGANQREARALAGTR